MYSLFKKIIFLFDAEKAHGITTGLLKLLNRLGLMWLFRLLFQGRITHKALDFQGLTFRNKLGLAAGFDKNADYLDELEKLGFGFVEIGTVTPLAQDGNPKPRLFRLPNDTALINRMGFNNKGVDYAVERIQAYKKKRPSSNLVIGGNIGKNKVTPNDEAHLDYQKCYAKLHDHVDYFVVNVSSPNTPNLRELQDKDALRKIFQELKSWVDAEQKDGKPTFVKISPDNSCEQIDDIISIVKEFELAGIVATNTTISRADLNTDSALVESIGAGGLSGLPVQERSDEVVKYIRDKDKDMFIIGVGGIRSADDATRKIEMGADLVQVYSCFIYEGPRMISRITQAVAQN